MRRVLVILTLGMSLGWAMADELDDARQRIEKARMGELRLRLVGEAGKPLEGVEVNVAPAQSAIRFGANLFDWGLCATPELEEAYRARFAELLNSGTLAFWWASYEPRQRDVQASQMENIVRWCHEHGLDARGYGLILNNEDPPWLPGDPRITRVMAMGHVRNCVRYFGPLAATRKGADSSIGTWDVVAEMTNFEQRAAQAPKLTEVWRMAGPIEVAREALQRARAGDQKGTLVVSDSVLDERFEKFIETLRLPDGNLPFDAIGLVMPMTDGAWDTERIAEVCTRFGRFGVPLHVTGLNIPSDGPDGEARQAREVERVYTELVAQPKVTVVNWGDFFDRKDNAGGLLRADMTPKPAYDVLKRLVKQDWQAGGTGRSDATGTFTCRVMRGDRWVSYKYGPVSGGLHVSVGEGDAEPVQVVIKLPHRREP
ncbi:MAG: endo-1,4-beta-xylanase [Phycisphaerae bacterium]|jgi:GH35 family endo-1,4-beta-xylanase